MGLLDAAAAIKGEHNQPTVVTTPAHSAPAEVGEINKAVAVVTEVSGTVSEEGSSGSSRSSSSCSSSSGEVKGQEVTSAQTFVIAATEIQVIEWDKVSQSVSQHTCVHTFL